MRQLHSKQLVDAAQEDDEDTELSNGFWQEFFLHRPDPAGLKRILDSVPPDEMLHLQSHSQQLIRRAIQRVKQGKPPTDEVALEVRIPPPYDTNPGLRARP
jgi:hypothetical protein